MFSQTSRDVFLSLKVPFPIRVFPTHCELQVDFFWINRDQRSFEWFVNLLSQLEIEQAELGGAMERFLEMHMYITSALQKTDMKAVGLQLALDLLHEKVHTTHSTHDPNNN